jgi:DNA-3-methyladenine glycosylase II
VEVSLPLPPLFDPDLSLVSLQRSSFAVPCHFSMKRRAVRRLVDLDGALSLVEFEFPAGGAELHVRLLASRTGEGGEAGTVSAERLGRVAYALWGLGDDLAGCYATLGDDPQLALVLSRYRGMRLFRAPDLYEALLVAMLGQQISVRAANACRVRLIDALGEQMEVAGVTYAAYPAPARLMLATVEDLRSVGTGVQKARYLHALAEAALSGKLQPEVFEDLSVEEGTALLCRVPGVGRWTAEVALLRGLGRVDAFPAGDLGLQVAVQRVFGLEQRPSESQLRVLAERWKPWRGYVAHYLWSYLRDST